MGVFLFRFSVYGSCFFIYFVALWYRRLTSVAFLFITLSKLAAVGIKYPLYEHLNKRSERMRVSVWCCT